MKAEPNTPVQYEPISLKQGRPLYQKTFSNLADTLAWLQENPYCFVEIIYETTSSIDAETRKTIMKAHDGIVNLIPRLTGDQNADGSGLRAEDLGKDMGTLFSQFYQSSKGVAPNEEISVLFNEIISQNEQL